MTLSRILRAACEPWVYTVRLVLWVVRKWWPGLFLVSLCALLVAVGAFAVLVYLGLNPLAPEVR